MVAQSGPIQLSFNDFFCFIGHIVWNVWCWLMGYSIGFFSLRQFCKDVAASFERYENESFSIFFCALNKFESSYFSAQVSDCSNRECQITDWIISHDCLMVVLVRSWVLACRWIGVPLSYISITNAMFVFKAIESSLFFSILFRASDSAN